MANVRDKMLSGVNKLLHKSTTQDYIHTKIAATKSAQIVIIFLENMQGIISHYAFGVDFGDFIVERLWQVSLLYMRSRIEFSYLWK